LSYFEASTGNLKKISSSGLLLGVRQDGMYDEEEFYLRDGDQLILVSDGMIDFEDEEGKKSDFEYFFKRLAELKGKKDIFEQIKNVTFSKESSKEQIDDCSLIVIQK